MPYKMIASVAGGKKGFRIRSQDGTYLSKNALPRATAIRQLRAVYFQEMRQKKK